jgi:Core-2/I-Branching enzyme
LNLIPPRFAEPPIRIVYIVLAHTLPDQLCRLVNRLDQREVRFLVHIDRRSADAEWRAARRNLARNDRVTLLPRRRCRRSTFGQVAAPLAALGWLATQSAVFDYAILLTGQDYPVKSHEVIARTLARSGRTWFLHAFPMLDAARSDWPVTEVHRYRDHHFWLMGRHFHVPLKRRIPRGLEPFGGSAYWALPREACRFITEFTEANGDVVSFFRHVYEPDEIFFQTIAMNSPVRGRVASIEGPHCLGVHYIDWPVGDEHPKILDMSDLPALNSTPALFARKFDMSIDRDVLDALDIHTYRL